MPAPEDCFRETPWFLLPGLLLGLISVVGTVPLHAQDTRTVTPGFDGVPLRYQRIYRYERVYPPGQGLYVKEIAEGSPTAKRGLRSGDIIVSIQGRPVQTTGQARRVLNETFGDTVTVRVHRIRHRYRHLMQTNPNYQPRRTNIYEQDEFLVRFETPRPLEVPVVAGEDHRLYHRLALTHSPDTLGRTVYPNPRQAAETGLEPCPVCFPAQRDPTLEALIERGFGKSRNITRELTARHESRTPLDGSPLQTISSNLLKQRINDSPDPRIRLIMTSRFHGYGLPDGEVLISQGNWRLAEGSGERAAELSHLIAHMDLRHEPDSLQTSRFQQLLERGIKQVTGLGVEIEDLKDLSTRLPGFWFYRDLMENGYASEQEREALFFALVSMHRSGYSMEDMKTWLLKRQDMEADVHPAWIDYVLKHPTPSYLMSDMDHWIPLIRQEFDGPEATGAHPETAP